MKTIIVGNGPSVLMMNIGEYIDQFDHVIRLKRCYQSLKHPKQFGNRRDILGGSLTIAKELLTIPEFRKFWVFLDSRHQGVDHQFIYQSGKDVLCDKALCDETDRLYNSLKETFVETGHPHTSQGMKSIAYALKHLEQDYIELVGFDNVYSGKLTWSTTRGPDWEHYPDHNWKIEKMMVPILSDQYKTPIGFKI